MLILTRKAEQGIVIDGKVVVRLLSVEGERVKIGVEAPRSISVLREELLVEVADANQAAAYRPEGGHSSLVRASRHLGRNDRTGSV